MPISPIVLLIYALAITRITGLITVDAITEGPRERIVRWLDDHPGTIGAFLAAILGCPWCAGIWVSAAAAPLVWWCGDSPWLLIPALALAFAQIIGMTSDVGR